MQNIINFFQSFLPGESKFTLLFNGVIFFQGLAFFKNAFFLRMIVQGFKQNFNEIQEKMEFLIQNVAYMKSCLKFSQFDSKLSAANHLKPRAIL